MGPTLGELGERGFIAELRRAVPHGNLMGDDSAVIPPLACPVVTTDSFFEGRHFHRWWAPPEVLGRRLLEATVSDLAAMGAEPAWLLAAVSLEPSMELDWLLAFYRGLASRRGTVIAGGETVRGPGFGLTLTAIGEGTEPGTLLRRSALRPGDRLWTGGPVGRSLDAPKYLEECGGLTGKDLDPVRDAVTAERLEQLRAFLTPSAQVELGQRLREEGVECAIDISDGLFSEARHLGEESGLDVVLKIDGSVFLPSVRERPLEAAAAGEDFLLLFGADEGRDFRDMGCLPVGRAEEGGTGMLTVILNGTEVPVRTIGYDHMEVD
ncbi:MAG: hypothetical protein AVO35_09470 [Candidatus Aegiribacteria sp. MLS_C]|nr:MAG: hypothetical protein AVO35_09470 [Candidatus Aegiribacteria sp. MLS_C]